jgi:hypothetical protein
MYVHLLPQLLLICNSLNCNSRNYLSTLIDHQKSRKIVANLLSFISDQANFMIKNDKKRQRSTSYLKLENEKLANASIDEKIDMRIKFIEFLKLNTLNYGNKIIIYLHFLMLLCINSIVVHAQKRKLPKI